MGQTITKFKKLSGAIILFISFATLGAGNLQAATGYVGDEKVEITRISNGRFVYPRAALRREIEGSVVLELTVGVTGDVVDAFVIEATPPNRFEKMRLNSCGHSSTNLTARMEVLRKWREFESTYLINYVNCSKQQNDLITSVNPVPDSPP
jgi:hypothetical protein